MRFLSVGAHVYTPGFVPVVRLDFVQTGVFFELVFQESVFGVAESTSFFVSAKVKLRADADVRSFHVLPEFLERSEVYVSEDGVGRSFTRKIGRKLKKSKNIRNLNFFLWLNSNVRVSNSNFSINRLAISLILCFFISTRSV